MPRRTTSPVPDVLIGILHLAIGRRDGIGQFPSTPQGFLSSLAPLVAFPLVGAFLLLLRGDALGAGFEFLATLCALLTPPVLSHALARAWRRETEWLRYATAFNWCQWVIPVALAILTVLAGIAVSAGAPGHAAELAVVGGLGLYGLWLHWFIARHGLALGGVRAAVLVIAVNLGTALVVLGPRMLAIWLGRAS